MKKITKPQQRAVCALLILHTEAPKVAAFSRYDMGRVSKGLGCSYPVSTMRRLWAAGYVEPLEDLAVELVETGRCRCGCDLWKITDKGREYCGSLDVRFVGR